MRRTTPLVWKPLWGRPALESRWQRRPSPDCLGMAAREGVVSMRSRQTGQAWAEFIVSALFVLVPMVIAVSMLGKYIDTRQKVEVAARYAAWERTVWKAGAPSTAPSIAQKSEAQIKREAQVRVFSRREEGIHSLQHQVEGVFREDPILNSPFVASGGQPEMLIEQAQVTSGDELPVYVDADIDEGRTPGVASSRVETAFDRIQSIPYVDNFDVNTRGTYTAEISVDLKPIESLGGPWSELDLTMGRSVTLVAAPWNVGGPAHNERRVQAFVPLGLLDVDILEDAFDMLSFFPAFEPLQDLEFGHVDVEPVPPQYLE